MATTTPPTALPHSDRLVCRQWVWAVKQSRAPRLRSLREFAEQEIVLPSGPYEGRRFRVDRQPFAGLWLDAVDSGLWTRFAVTAPSQSGKTLLGSLIPLCYHLFEVGERVIFGLPDMDMAADKWRDEILPIIERTRYRDLLPAKGGGSRGGKVRAIKFRNGAVLRFMSAGGSDKSRAAYTSRVLVVTEVDGFDLSSAASREADKLKQLEARVRAYGPRRRVYLECTVSIEQGRIWREYLGGTASKIMLPCPHCRAWVAPDREQLVGWQDAENEHEAAKLAHFGCPACGAIWSEEDRRTANFGCRLVHRGQSIDAAGKISGEPPPTDTLGFRWSAANNLFTPAGQVGVDEWKAARDPNEDNSEREMRQFVWCLPYQPPTLDVTPLDPQVIRTRFAGDRKGFLPADAQFFTVAVDPGKRVSWWIAVAWRPGAGPHVVDYGTFEVRSDDLGYERALLIALRDFRDGTVMQGWALPGGQARIPDRITIDARYQGRDDAKVVYAFCRESGNRRWLPTLGCGMGRSYYRNYRRPKKTGGGAVYVGEEYHVVYLPADGVFVVETNADYWKGWLHQRLSTPIDQPGAATFYHSTDRNEHISLAKHLTAEKQREEFIPGKGTVIRWEQESRKNHWFDCFYNACVSGHLCGARLIERLPSKTPRRPAAERRGLTMPDGRPYLITER